MNVMALIIKYIESTYIKPSTVCLIPIMLYSSINTTIAITLVYSEIQDSAFEEGVVIAAINIER